MFVQGFFCDFGMNLDEFWHYQVPTGTRFGLELHKYTLPLTSHQRVLEHHYHRLNARPEFTQHSLQHYSVTVAFQGLTGCQSRSVCGHLSRQASRSSSTPSAVSICRCESYAPGPPNSVISKRLKHSSIHSVQKSL